MRWAVLAAHVFATGAVADDLLKDGRRVLFLGDSNTFGGRFVGYLDLYLVTRFPDRKLDLINLGLPSETVTGLSEPDHPYPRPNVHDRLAAALTRIKPDVVVACYGMNDGIYYPFDAGRFKQYQDTYLKLIADCEKAGAKVVLLTPSPFDPKPLGDKLQAKGAEKYSWVRPYAGYDDDVLTRYAAWLVTLKGKGYAVADAHTAVKAHLAKMRKLEPDYLVSADGIHPDTNGNYVVFRELLRAFDLPEDGPAAAVDAAKGTSATTGVKDVKVGLGSLDFTWTTRVPFPRDPAWSPRLVEVEGVPGGASQFQLTVTGLPAGSHSLFEGDKLIVTATAEEWKAGVDLAKSRDLSANRRAADVWKQIKERTRILGQAWLTDVGHKRPDTPKGIPLADAQKKSADLDAKAREAARPVELKLRVTKAK